MGFLRLKGSLIATHASPNEGPSPSFTIGPPSPYVLTLCLHCFIYDQILFYIAIFTSQRILPLRTNVHVSHLYYLLSKNGISSIYLHGLSFSFSWTTL